MIVTQRLRVCYSTHLLFGNFLKEIKVTACTKMKSYIPYEILPTLFLKVKLMDKRVVSYACQLYLNDFGAIIFVYLRTAG